MVTRCAKGVTWGNDVNTSTERATDAEVEVERPANNADTTSESHSSSTGMGFQSQKPAGQKVWRQSRSYNWEGWKQAKPRQRPNHQRQSATSITTTSHTRVSGHQVHLVEELFAE